MRNLFAETDFKKNLRELGGKTHGVSEESF
jgi:hypothetical protein